MVLVATGNIPCYGLVRPKGQILLLVICYRADYSTHNGSGAKPEEIQQYFSSKIVPHTPVILRSRITIACDRMKRMCTFSVFMHNIH